MTKQKIIIGLGVLSFITVIILLLIPKDKPVENKTEHELQILNNDIQKAEMQIVELSKNYSVSKKNFEHRSGVMNTDYKLLFDAKKSLDSLYITKKQFMEVFIDGK